MPRTDRPYSRVYWEVIGHRKFAEVWEDDATLGLWLRLLILADKAYPEPGTLPAGLPTRRLARLVSAGLVERSGRSSYRVHGLDEERDRRSSQGRAGGQARKDGRSANGPPDG